MSKILGCLSKWFAHIETKSTFVSVFSNRGSDVDINFVHVLADLAGIGDDFLMMVLSHFAPLFVKKGFIVGQKSVFFAPVDQGSKLTF